MQNYLSKKSLIVGLGLIGGSFALALRDKKISSEIYAFDIDYDSIESAKNNKLIDGYVLLDQDLTQFDLVVIASNLKSYKKILPKLFRNSSPNSTIIDLGSVKNLDFLNLPKNFVACHPVAGSEKSGFENARIDLFFGKKFIICPENSEITHIQRIEKIVREFGAIPEFLGAKDHDKIFAITSHLPQFLSFCFREFSPKNVKNSFLQNAFRLDDSNDELWGDIFKFNEKNLQFFYEKFFANLERLIDDLEKVNFVDLLNSNQVIQDLAIKIDRAPNQQDLEFFEENFVQIAYRIIVVIAFIQIEELKKYQNYFGKGILDFISILKILSWNHDIQNLLIKNLKKIQSIFKQISS